MLQNPFIVLEKQLKKITVQEKTAFFMTIFSGILCHLFMLTNKIPNHDELRTYSIYGGTVISGRPLVRMPDYLSGLFGAPWKEGMIALLYVAIICVILCKLFDIKNRIICGLLGIMLVTFPTVASCLGYMYMADIFFFSTLISCGAVFFAEKYRVSGNNKKNLALLLCGIVLAIGLCIYQLGFVFAVGLILVMLICQELELDDSNKWELKVFLKKVLYYVCLILIGLVFYYLFIKISLVITGLSLTSRKGISTAGIDTIINLPTRIVEAYKQFIWYFFIRRSETVISFALPLITGICSFIGLYYTAVIAFRKGISQNVPRAIMLILMMLCLPIAVEFIYIIQEPADIKYHMAYGIVLWYVFILIIFDRMEIRNGLSEKRNRKYLSMWVLLCGLIVIQYDNYLYTANAYNAAYFTYEQTYSYFSNMVSRIEQIDGFSYETPVAIIGGVTENEKPATLPKMKAFTSQNPDKTHPKVSLPGELVLINTYAHPFFIKHFLGYDLMFCDNKQKEEIASTEEFEKMPCYPANGSVKNIDGIIVVKQRDLN